MTSSPSRRGNLLTNEELGNCLPGLTSQLPVDGPRIHGARLQELDKSCDSFLARKLPGVQAVHERSQSWIVRLEKSSHQTSSCIRSLRSLGPGKIPFHFLSEMEKGLRRAIPDWNSVSGSNPIILLISFPCEWAPRHQCVKQNLFLTQSSADSPRSVFHCPWLRMTQRAPTRSRDTIQEHVTCPHMQSSRATCDICTSYAKERYTIRVHFRHPLDCKHTRLATKQLKSSAVLQSWFPQTAFCQRVHRGRQGGPQCGRTLRLLCCPTRGAAIAPLPVAAS